MKFTKMQGLGNDFIIINAIEEAIEEPEELTRKICQPHFGVGADGLILILPSDKADFRIRIFTPDGNETSMSGNGIRCVAKYLYENKLAGSTRMRIETPAGIKTPEIINNLVRVDLGEPILEREQIPMKGQGKAINIPINLKHRVTNVTCLSMGNPQAITFVETFNFSIEELGKEIEMHALFPERTNVGFAQVVNKQEINLCTWERGAGITLACGTGAAASLVASVLDDKTNRKVIVHLLGGDLEVEWDESNNHVYLTGPAKKVFDGVYWFY